VGVRDTEEVERSHYSATRHVQLMMTAKPSDGPAIRTYGSVRLRVAVAAVILFFALIRGLADDIVARMHLPGWTAELLYAVVVGVPILFWVILSRWAEYSFRARCSRWSCSSCGSPFASIVSTDVRTCEATGGGPGLRIRCPSCGAKTAFHLRGELDDPGERARHKPFLFP